MAGYDYSNGMSNNAVEAYRRGLVPASKVPGVPSALVKVWGHAVEWHHSSKFYNKTRFYDPQEVRAIFGLEGEGEYPEAVAALAAWKAARSKKEVIYLERCAVSWTEFDKSGRRWIPTEVEHKSVTVHQCGDRLEIIAGDTVVKKMRSSRSLSFTSGRPISELAWKRRLKKVTG